MNLRCNLFKTVERRGTRFICFRDTRTEVGRDVDAIDIDLQHAIQGRFGIGYHFLIDEQGVITLCRDVDTHGSHSRNYDAVSVAVGFVGGKRDGADAYTRNPEQLEAAQDLTEVLMERYPYAGLNDQYLLQ